MSRILERLRSEFGDELLVRNGRAYERSPRAERLLVRVREILERVDQAARDDTFDPLRCDATFRVATTDYVSAVLVPNVLRELSTRAPDAMLELSVSNDRTFDDVAAGRVDFAITSVGDPQPSFRRATLFTDTFVCLVARNHPIRSRRMSLARYLDQRHVAIDVLGGAQPAIDRTLALRGERRTIAYRTPYLTSAALAIAETSLVLTVPSRLATAIATGFGVRAVGAPSELERFAYATTWHPRLDASPAHVWFRTLVDDVATRMRER